MYHEERLNEIGSAELVLAHQPAQGLGSAAAAGSVADGGGHEGKTRERGHPPQRRLGGRGTAVAAPCRQDILAARPRTLRSI